jgi:hypothetical protein
MTRLLHANLPFFIESLSAPTAWRSGRSYRNLAIGGSKPVPLSSLLGTPSLNESDFLTVRKIAGETSHFDPWEKRTEFFRLKRGDRKALVAFLESIGLFERAHVYDEGPGDNAVLRTNAGVMHEVRYLSEFREKHIWDMRDLLLKTLKRLKNLGNRGQHSDFQVRLVRKSGKPRAIVTTTTFVDAVVLTLTIDRVEDAKVQKCARRDCSATFSFTAGHRRKYCQWYCGHIESVRNRRVKEKQARTKFDSRVGIEKDKK